MISPPYSSRSSSDAGSPLPRTQATLVIEERSSISDNTCAITTFETPRPRTKAAHQKVRTGCLRCKQRRIKCDESLPSCLRCLRINEPCPGYQQPLTRVFGLSTLQGFNNEFEKTCFDSFFSGGSMRLALFQPSTKSFWITILPQLCQLHLPLRHGAIALAYINEPFYNPNLAAAVQSNSSVNTLETVMTHFNKSMRGFVQNINRLSIDAKLSCCIVFSALTIYMYRIGAVSSHVSAALTFIRQHEQLAGPGDPVLKQVLAPVIRRLVIDACTFSGAMHGFRRGDNNPYEEYMYEVLKLPTNFNNFEDAYELVCNFLKYAIALAFGHVEHYGRVDVYLHGVMRRFETVFGKSVITIYAGAQVPEDIVAFYRSDLLLHHTLARLIARFRPEMMEPDYWMFLPEFEDVVETLQNLLKIEPKDQWRITLCWIPPLFLVATKCRASNLRKLALGLIHKLSRVERGWTSCVAYTLAKFVIEQEEVNTSHAEDLPYIQYVRLLSIRFDHDTQTAFLQYILQRDRMSLGIFSAHLPMKVLMSKTLGGAPAINVPDPVLQAFGYTGTTMFSPRIRCHCHNGSESVQYTGKVMNHDKEEVVVWEAGFAIRKVVKHKEQLKIDSAANRAI